MAINYAVLETELTTDPNGYGYAPLVAAGADAVLADMLNEVRPSITVRRIDVSPNEVLEAIDVRDFVANPNAGWVAWFESVTQLRTMRLLLDDGSNTRVRSNLNRLLGDTNGSMTRVQTISQRTGSRAEQLFGPGTVLAHGDISRALRE